MMAETVDSNGTDETTPSVVMTWLHKWPKLLRSATNTYKNVKINNILYKQTHLTYLNENPTRLAKTGQC